MQRKALHAVHRFYDTAVPKAVNAFFTPREHLALLDASPQLSRLYFGEYICRM